MTTTIVLVCIISWFLVGALSFLYWHTKLLAFTTDDLLICAVFTLGGLLSFIACPLAYYLYLRNPTVPKVLIKKRK